MYIDEIILLSTLLSSSWVGWVEVAMTENQTTHCISQLEIIWKITLAYSILSIPPLVDQDVSTTSYTGTLFIANGSSHDIGMLLRDIPPRNWQVRDTSCWYIQNGFTVMLHVGIHKMALWFALQGFSIWGVHPPHPYILF